jgi:hypothetical protein
MSFFTRRHFIWLVEMAHELEFTDEQVEQLMDLCSLTNPRFNREMFAKAVLKKWMEA